MHNRKDISKGKFEYRVYKDKKVLCQSFSQGKYFTMTRQDQILKNLLKLKKLKKQQRMSIKPGNSVSSEPDAIDNCVSKALTNVKRNTKI